MMKEGNVSFKEDLERSLTKTEGDLMSSLLKYHCASWACHELKPLVRSISFQTYTHNGCQYLGIHTAGHSPHSYPVISLNCSGQVDSGESSPAKNSSEAV